ncbi:MAG TPA: sigma factor-like helix-turn-helix DNA-binding protein, partial [Chitinophagaceae bacterium]|nr:sigma factor-like helix-turn-helix DNA-binding protein [Chitinophagaceae bacterium]
VAVEGTDHSLLEKQYESILRAAVGHLPEKQRQTYRLIKQQGLKREEAARELAVSPETVKYNLEQAMRSIRAYCLAQLDGHPGLLLFILLVRNIF